MGRRLFVGNFLFYFVSCIYLFSLTYPRISPEMTFISNLHLLIIPQNNLKGRGQHTLIYTGHII